ncbi:MAG: protein-tyrosine-phosphatase [Crocinitomicaceae bacterium]
MNKKIETIIDQIKSEFNLIPEDRKAALQTLSDFIKEKKQNTDLIFICVHNSRRSHLSQIWAQVASNHYGFNQIRCYSGGTEVTNMYPMIGETLQDQGFDVQVLAKTENPIYALKYDANSHPIMGFSKIFDDSFNPQENFGAVMVCSSADTNCPYIATASKRILIPFEDPKAFDDTPQQKEKYAERSLQIARELFYAFSQV